MTPLNAVSRMAIVTLGLMSVHVSAVPHCIDTANITLPRDRGPDPAEDGPIFCGKFPSADKSQAWDLEKQMMVPRAEWDCSTKAGECNRVHCWATSAVYVCNDNDHDVSIKCGEVALRVKKINMSCCNSFYRGTRGRSGQVFTKDGWNVVLSYANCNYPGKRPDETGGWGVNPVCHDDA